MRLFLSLLLILIFLISGCSNEKNKIVEYGDFKCPYCKQVEDKIMPKLKKDYIDKNNVNYQFVNMAFLGKDTIKGSRAGHAVQNIAPNHYLEFQKLIFSKQPNHENEWLTEQLIDRQIDKLDISDKKAKKIKKDYKTKNSQSWKDAQKDIKLYKDKKVKEAPTVYVNGKKLKDPYNYAEYKKYLK
ncbi:MULTISPECIES: DsbA family protein [Staphylococcus]|uniref:DsbA family protein n=1 Tax=Staphylococcus TaxID=1279 RepID=UPI0011A49DA1|nr:MULTISPECIES: DsbA family protein [Staphylococcus]HCX9014051.1 DsbA family protein [Staphylococcus aureus]MBO1199978.1 DsbA family protein [Staphylococcus simiae]MBO1202248.1 DsbA family protein [Staphylococcus simiae]MBO1212055.1 DsbA family protein [Staphylococcus simiae]MBO1230530.1 DsbA family protein [Staphylococcus simiae]